MRSLILVALLLPLVATAGEEYYKLTPTVYASAATRGDELFAELVTPTAESDVVGAPRSMAIKIYGSCSQRVFTNQGVALFSGRYRAGYPVGTLEADNIIRKVTPGSMIDKLFKKECAK